MNAQITAWLEYYTRPFGGLESLRAGCPECEGPRSWPIARLWWYAQLVVAIYSLASIVGAWPVITSAFRCRECNTRRDGAGRSRHLAGTDGGERYAAVDIQWDEGVAGVLVDHLADIPDFIRFSTGLDVGVGVIAYRGRRRLHVDFRERDYISDQT